MNYDTRDMTRVYNRLRRDAKNPLYPNFEKIPDSFDRDFFEEWYYTKLSSEKKQIEEKKNIKKTFLLEGGTYYVDEHGVPKAIDLTTDHIIKHYEEQVMEEIAESLRKMKKSITKELEEMYGMEVSRAEKLLR